MKDIGRRVAVGIDTKPIVVWGTGFVGRIVIAEIVEHPLFELVGVGGEQPREGGPRRRRDLPGLRS
ncbi:MAG TPA: hypothetical protein VHS97_23835 [Isosphaeraceae bacterium]|nr:hypothetical protein [Isosphaeraceae bacterium]